MPGLNGSLQLCMYDEVYRFSYSAERRIVRRLNRYVLRIRMQVPARYNDNTRKCPPQKNKKLSLTMHKGGECKF